MKETREKFELNWDEKKGFSSLFICRWSSSFFLSIFNSNTFFRMRVLDFRNTRHIFFSISLFLSLSRIFFYACVSRTKHWLAFAKYYRPLYLCCLSACPFGCPLARPPEYSARPLGFCPVYLAFSHIRALLCSFLMLTFLLSFSVATLPYAPIIRLIVCCSIQCMIVFFLLLSDAAHSSVLQRYHSCTHKHDEHIIMHILFIYWRYIDTYICVCVGYRIEKKKERTCCHTFSSVAR